jgi:hypothetical protein
MRLTTAFARKSSNRLLLTAAVCSMQGDRGPIIGAGLAGSFFSANASFPHSYRGDRIGVRQIRQARR